MPDNDSSDEAPFKKAKIEKRAGTSFQFPLSEAPTCSSLPIPKNTPHEAPKGKVYPKSLSISEIMKLGKVVKAPTGRKLLKLYRFDIQSISWSDIPTEVECQIESEAFAEGGFRSAHRSTITTPEFS